jgi:hypothetical protein
MSQSLRDLAQQRLDQLEGIMSIERIWLLSALKSTAEGTLIEPELEILKQLTADTGAWDGVSRWRPEDVWSRIAAVMSSHRLAIVKRDDEWLAQLYAVWETCPESVGELWRLRAEGEIGLGLAPAGPRPSGWSEEELSLLDEEGFLLTDAPPDRVWRALARQDFEAARQALADYEQSVVAVPQQWETAPSKGLHQILSSPDAVLQVQRRALATLVGRWGR